MRIVLASNNRKKLSELRALLGALPIELLPQGELGIPEAEEPHITFIENALAKARQAARLAGGAAIADDSGVCVDALGGAPGVISANLAPTPAVEGDREARRAAQDAANNTLLLARLYGVRDRRAAFVSTLVALRHAEDPQPLVAVGRWPGEILHAPQGTQGFGYDPLMFIPELGCTVAELDADEKNQHSHRARAAAAMVALLKDAWHLA
jgi:XTP/dITP diphosphohydrolase